MSKKRPTLKQKFFAALDMQPIKNSKPNTDRNNNTDNDILDLEKCFYYFDEDDQGAQVTVCRGCYKRFTTWIRYRTHFNTACQITEVNFKLNTYNEVYKQHKLKKKSGPLYEAYLEDLKTKRSHTCNS